MSEKQEIILDAIFDAVLEGDIPGAPGLVQQALDAGLAPETILNDGMIAAMAEVGARYECGDIYVAEMFISAKTLQGALNVLRPHLRSANVQAKGKVVVGTVKGDMHDIGKNLVGMMLEGNGFSIVDLGVDVAPARFVAAVEQHRPAIVGMSALLTTTMPGMATTLRALESAGVRDGVKVMVGGAPVTAEYAASIGADSYASDAAAAARVARTLLGMS